MPANTDNRVTLGDGRFVGYAEYGDLKGKPMVYFHGLPSSRLEINNPELIEIAEQLQIRVILVDRAGIGLSDFRPYTIATYPDIVAEFAGKLGLDRFPVIGVSSGGKFVAASAWKIPERLTSATIVSGTAPFSVPGVREALSKQDQQLYGIADRVPWLFRLVLWKVARDVRKDPSSILSLFSDLSEVDKAVMAQPNVSRTFGQMVVESFRQGTRGAALDWMLEARPWDFSLHDIKLPVSIWHGEDDNVVPFEHARILAQAMPSSQVKMVPGEGHTLFVRRFRELLQSAVE